MSQKILLFAFALFVSLQTSAQSSNNQFRNDKFSGETTISWPNGDTYSGNYENGLVSGFGTYTWANGDRYVGHWKENKRDGRGTYYFANGKNVYGIWMEDKLLKAEDSESQQAPVNPSKNLTNRSQQYNPPPVSQIETNEDVDFYLAQVSSNVNFRSGPGTGYSVICTISAGSYVFLSTADSGNEFRKVLYIDKGEYGYVHRKFLTNLTKVDADKSGSLTVKSHSNKPTADVEIYNNTSRFTTVTIGSQSFKLSPQEKRTVTGLKPGRYKNTASSPGVRPYVGIDNLEAGRIYSWTFYITTL